MTMLRLLKASAASMIALVACAPPTQAQITAMVDETGKRVFVNEAAPAIPVTLKPVVGAPRSQPASTRRSATAPTTSFTVEQLQQLATEIAERYQLDPDLIRAIIDQESNWNPEAVSYKGALGLMQLMPGTAGDLGVTDPFDPQQNLEGGVRHLRGLLERYGGDLDRALAAYNAGGGAVDRAGGVPNYRETRNYVQKITDNYFQPGSGRQPIVWRSVRKVYQSVDARGRRVFTNE